MRVCRLVLCGCVAAAAVAAAAAALCFVWVCDLWELCRCNMRICRLDIFSRDDMIQRT